MSSKKSTLADSFASLIDPAPSFDPEDDAEEETRAKLIDNLDDDFDEEQEASVLRRQAASVTLDDKRYAGRKISRKDLNESSDEEEEDSSGDEVDKDKEFLDEEEDDKEENSDFMGSESDEASDDNLMESTANDDEELSNESIDESDVDDNEGDMFPNTLEAQGEEESGFQHFSSHDRVSEAQKGVAVKNQLMVWDNLLEIRIQLQKTLKVANQMPVAENFSKFANDGGKDFKTAQTKCASSVTNLLNKLIDLQNAFFKQNPEIKNVSSSKRQKDNDKGNDDEEIPSSEEDAIESEEDNVEAPPKKKMRLDELGNTISTSHSSFVNFRNSTIQKWSDKTRIAQGKFSSKNFSAFEQSTLQQIEHIMADKNRLLRRTRMQRSNYRILGSKEITDEESGKDEKPEQLCNEIFDDDDFYHQLLRELIEHKSEGVTDPVQLGRQWISLQKLRSKMKRKIDTRATKGRKIRHTVIPKLVNFMAPVDHSEWTDEAKNELFASLFAG